MKKMHYIISTNSMELERINKLLIGEDSSFALMETKIEGIHTSISTQLVKTLMTHEKKK
jgi:hypothetical protein